MSRLIIMDQSDMPDVKMLCTIRHPDHRGAFQVNYTEEELYDMLGVEFKQSNVSWSNKLVMRGMHFQRKDREQGKLVQCLNGCVADFFMDIRPDSPTFGKCGYEMLHSPHLMLYIPEGFAHGFVAHEPNSIVQYRTTDTYAPETEGIINMLDAADKHFNNAFDKSQFIMTDKDKNAPTFGELKETF